MGMRQGRINSKKLFFKMTKFSFGQKLLVLNNKTRSKRHNDVGEIHLPKHLKSNDFLKTFFPASRQ